MTSLARERAEYILECAQLDADAMAAMGTPNVDTPQQKRRDADRAWARERDREIWMTATLPRILAEAQLARSNNGTYV